MRLRLIPVVLAAIVAGVVFWRGTVEPKEEGVVAAIETQPARAQRPFDVPELLRTPDVPPAPQLGRFELQLLNANGTKRDGEVSVRRGDEVAEIRVSHRGLLKGWLMPGRYSFESYFDRTVYSSGEYRIEAGQTQVISLTVGRTPVKVRGTVVGVDDAPIREFKVDLEGGSSVEVFPGRFQAETTRRETWLTVTANGYAPETARIEPPVEDLKIVLRAEAEIAVKVVTATGDAVLDAEVDLTSGTFHLPERGDRLSTRFPIAQTQVPAGLMKVRAVRVTEKGLERGSTELALPAGQRGEAVVVLNSATGLEGVVTLNGVPQPDLRVIALAAGERALTANERAVMSAITGPEDAAGFTGKDGRFDLRPLHVTSPATKYRIHALGPGLREPGHPVFLELGGPPVKIALEAIERSPTQ